MSLPRGFKAQANRIAVGVRHQLGLRPEDPIALSQLAKRMHIELVSLKHVMCDPDHVRQLSVRDPSAFSAVLIPLEGSRKLILYNHKHSKGRRNSSIAHELSHALLAHPPSPPFESPGHRALNTRVEQEANCLSGHLLLPNEAAISIVWSSEPESSVLERYGVSRQMLEYRLNASGARVRKQRVGRQRARSRRAGRSQLANGLDARRQPVPAGTSARARPPSGQKHV